MKVVTTRQMRDLEQASVRAGVSLDDLMENAGLAVAEAIRDRLPSPGSYVCATWVASSSSILLT